MAGSFHYFEEPRFARWLFGTPHAGWIWLVARVYLGYYWFRFGWDKIFGADSDWMTTGGSLEGYLNSRIDPAAPEVYFGWYGDVIGWMADNAAIWAKVIAVGELAIGLGLMLGAFTGIAAFFALLLNANIMLAAFAGGPAPLFLVIEIGLVLAWRNAGYIGMDRFLLPLLGTFEEPGRVFRQPEIAEPRPMAGTRT